MLLRRVTYLHPEFRRGFLDMLAISPGIAAWGLMTGVAMGKSGLHTLEALFMALIVFAGSAQLAATPLLLAGAPMWVVLATALCVNLRFVVFSAHLRPFVMHLPLGQRLVTGFFTGDLSYVLFVKRYDRPAQDEAGREAQTAYLLGNDSINWLSWTTSCSTGVVLAHFIPAHWGLGFAGILALVGMLCSLASTRLRWTAALVAGTAAVAAFALPLKLNILVAIAAAVLVCLLLERSSGAPPTAHGAKGP
jgi:predicted branched-subunit amino acid permease